MKITSCCKKLKLPNGKVVDILSEIMIEFQNWLQDVPVKAEAGGYIVGYQHNETRNITLEMISTPYSLDKRTRTFSKKVSKELLYGSLAYTSTRNSGTIINRLE